MLARRTPVELFVTQSRVQGCLTTRIYVSRPGNTFFFRSHEDVRTALRRWIWLLDEFSGEYIKRDQALQNGSAVRDSGLSIMDWLSDTCDSDSDDGTASTVSATSSTAEREARQEEMNFFGRLEAEGWRASPNGYKLRQWVTETRDLSQELTTSQLNLFVEGTGYASKKYDKDDLVALWAIAHEYNDLSLIKGEPTSIFAWLIRYYL